VVFITGSLPLPAESRSTPPDTLKLVSLAHRVDPYRPRVDYRVDGYRPKPVPPEALPGYVTYVIPLDSASWPVDAQGVAVSSYSGHKVYHPLVIARYGLVLLNSYRVTQDPAYLDRIKANANFLVNRGVLRDGALYLPYRFNYGSGATLMRAPWYSAIAQGAALTLFVRLLGVTGEQRWRTVADSIFATFQRRRSATRPWTVFTYRQDHRRYLWFEEYPKDPPEQVLNGHIYSLFGVYEYALATGKTAAMSVFDGGATAVRRQAYRFRVPGEISYYSLRFHQQYASYHCIHVGMFKLLARMTADPWFAREARRFAADAPRAAASC
jgi:D-glucuronyl C5-epimerase C-terminus